LGFFP
jgi:6-phosphofructokinase 1